MNVLPVAEEAEAERNMELIRAENEANLASALKDATAVIQHHARGGSVVAPQVEVAAGPQASNNNNALVGEPAPVDEGGLAAQPAPGGGEVGGDDDDDDIIRPTHD